MIDIENIVFDKIRAIVNSVYPKAYIESTYVDRASSFPCVSFVESDNTDYIRTIEISGEVKHNNLTYDCNIYTTGMAKKSEAKGIANLIDKTMSEMGFRRTMRSQIPNVERTIYRIVMRFTGIVAKGVQNGGNTVYQIYKQ